MNMCVLILTMLFNGLAQSENNTVLNDLGSLQWKNRIVVLNEIENQVEVLSLLEANQVEIKERDILWFILADESVISNFNGELGPEFLLRLRKNHVLVAGQVILIGKDGGLKSNYIGVNLKSIFSDIDAMPMRRREISQ